MRANRTLPAAVEAAPTENCRGTIGNPELLMQSNQKNRSGLRKVKQRGSELIEFTLVLLPFLGFTFLILNIAWAVYVRSTLQYAVAQGVRYAVTSQTKPGMNQMASIQTVVQSNAFGHLSSTPGKAPTLTNGWNNIYVNCFNVDPNTGAVTDVTLTSGCGPVNSILPLVQVSVQSISQKTFMPTVKFPGLTTLAAINMTAVAWDRMEAPPLAANGTQNPPAM